MKDVKSRLKGHKNIVLVAERALLTAQDVQRLATMTFSVCHYYTVTNY